MSRKSSIAIVVGILVLLVTYLAFTALFNATAPTEAEILDQVATGTRAGVNDLMERSQQAETIRIFFFVIAAVEVIITGILAYQWRSDR
jgi:hypothetical protein